MAKNIKRMFALVMAIVMVLGLGVSALASTDMNKTAQWSDEKYVADVTLSVGGESDVIGSDIIYIVGSYASNSDGSPNVKGDVLISSLVETITEMVEAGTVVNFGMVPFSSDNVVAMPLTAISEANIGELPGMIASALATCEALYDGVNMENALIKAKKMFSASPLAAHPERQHLVMISSGFTYFFNSGSNNEYVSTVPVNYPNVNRLFFWNKAWQRARLNQTNTYPIPKGVVEAYNASASTKSLWDFYWDYIETWTIADRAAGDTVVYEACTIESGNFLKWYNSGELVSGYSQTGYGKAVPEAEMNERNIKISDYVTLTAGANPITNEDAAHAIGYERAMYEAYEYAMANLVGQGINFYPIYNALDTVYTNGNWSPESYNVTWTNQYIGHSFMNKLAGGEAIKYETKGDKTFFAPIKNQIVNTVGAGSFVDDYMGYGAEYNFDFIDELGTITLKVGGVKYTTSKLDTAKEGFISSYAFTAPGAETPTFWLDYVKGNGTSEEMFKWSFGESASNDIPVVLDYQVRLVESPANLADELICDTNKVATLYPNGGTPEEFPVPKVTLTPVTYTVTYMNGNVTEQKTSGHKTGDIIPGCVAPEDYFDDTYKYTFSHWKLIEGTEGENKTVGTTDLVYEAVFKSKLITTPEDPTLGKKTDEQLGNDLSYEVKIEVPGNADMSHDEVIIMMDGSYSGDGEWPQARNAILEIGKAVLDGSGHTKLTLMAFGMADNMVLRHINSVSELAARLPEGGLPGGLLYGRSSTNCEAGFTGVAEYVETDAQLRDAYVIFISDGNVNTDETPRAFDADWKAMSTKFGALTVAQACFENCVAYGENLPAAFSMFGDRFAGLSKEETLASAFAGETPVTEEEFFAFAEQVWTDVYAYSGLVRGVEYPISEVETAFVKYDKEKGTYVQDLFYYATYKSNLVTYPNRWSRTPMAATELASMVAKLYTIDVDGKSNWMDPATGSNPSVNVVGDNVSFTHINAFANFSTVFAAALEELAETVFSNVVVTDYMSKWVNLDPTSVHVVDENTGATIWSATNGWLITENLPTTVEPPVKIEVVSPADYAGGGADVEGNKSGDIYKLTWHVKDGALLRTDNFSLRYNVTVDTAEEGFYPGVSYPANGNTTVTYTGGSNDIKVPNVNVKAYTVTYWTPDGRVIQQTGGLKTGDAIPYCAGLGSYAAGDYTYYFVGWNKTSGVEGAGGKIGTSDLDYVAVMNYAYSDPIPETPTYIEDKVPLAAVPSVFGDDHFAYIVGYPDGNVRPEGNITRAEVATIFFRLLSEEVRQMMWCEENDFSDVNKGSWYNNAISTMAAMGIVEGYPDGTFQPDEFITRAEFAAIAARFELNGNPEGNFFNDTEGHWAEELINIAANNGWVEGYPDGSFRPDNDITRAEAMTLVNRVLHRIPEDESDLLDGMVEWPDNMDKKMWYYLAVQEATNSHDYKRKENPIYETWVDLRENRDWTELEY